MSHHEANPAVLKLDKDHIDQVEHDISPLMRKAITIPVTTESGQDVAIIYVALSPFKPGISNAELTKIAKAIRIAEAV